MTTDALKQLDDDALARRAAAGERDALEVLLERHSRTAARMAYAILHRHDDALDAAQTALLKVAQELPAWSRAGFKGWLHACVHSAAVNLLRHNAMRRRHAETLQAQAAQEHAMADETAARQEQLALLREELAELPAETAAALALFHLQGLSVAEVAAETGLSADACKQRLSRGREQLRVKLERRGVALAGVAVVALIDTLCGSANAWAAELPPDALQRITQPALSHTAGAAQPVATGTATPQSDSRQRQLARALPAAGILTMIKSHPLAFGAGAAVLFGTLAGVLLLSKPSVANRQSGTPATNTAVADKGQASPASAGTPNTPAVAADNTRKEEATPSIAGRNAPTWQTPRALKISGSPLAVAAQGVNAAVLLADLNELQLVTSKDGGTTWLPAAALPSYTEGTVAVRHTGQVVVAAIAMDQPPQGKLPPEPTPEQMAKVEKLLADMRAGKDVKKELEEMQRQLLPYMQAMAGERKHLRLEWHVLNDQGYAKPETIFTAGANESFVGRPVVACGPTATWVFAMGATNASTVLRMHVARGGGDSLPQPVADLKKIKPLTSAAWGRTFDVAAWGLDAENAGFAATNLNGVLTHFFTNDGGKTWQERAIPFALDDASGSQQVTLSPMKMSRHGRRLVLLARCGRNAKGSKNPFDNTEQYLVLHSADLGATWSTPVPVSERANAMDAGTGALSVHAGQGRMAVARLQKQQDGGHSPVVSVSEDGGQSWFNQHAFDAFKNDLMGCILGGDEDALHVALASGIGPDAILVVRSFTTRELKAPAAPLPAWLKEKKLPAPTKEDF